MFAENEQRAAGDGVDFREVVSNLVDGVLVTDGEGKIVFVNPSYCRHLGAKPDELVGRSVFDIASEGKLFRHSVCADVIRSRRRVSGAGYMRTVNGKRINGYAAGVPIFDSEGDIRLVVSTLTDINELRTRFERFRGTVRGEAAIQIFDRFVQTGEPFPAADPAAAAVRKRAEELAKTDLPLLITGEEGVGKEVLADYILSHSPRAESTYVKINCAVIPERLLEPELFGSEDSEGPGLLEMAEGGTVLLGEIDSLPPELQRELLYALSDRGKDLRVLAAAGGDFVERLKTGEFNRELYGFFSPNVLNCPPLRERRDDIMPLTRFFFREYCEKHGRELILPDSAALDLEAYSWPGNIRELKNIIEYVVICSEGGTLDLTKLSELLDAPPYGRPSEVGLHEAVNRFEKQMIEDALINCGGVRRAAAYLKVDPSTISRKAKKYGISLLDRQP